MRTVERSLCVVLLAAAVFTLAACGNGKGRSTAFPGTSVRIGAFSLKVPRGFHRCDVRGGLYRTGTTPPVIGLLISDYRLKAGPKSAFYKWAQFEAPPANRVALQVAPWNTIGVVTKPQDLHLPLSPNQPAWFDERTKKGTPGYHWGFFELKGQQYEVFLWSGPAAPPHDRTALLNALASVRLAS